MSTWRLLSDDGSNYYWEFSGCYQRVIAENTLSGAPVHSLSRLPSMSDLLLQGGSKLLEITNANAKNETLPVFRTGSGKSVAIKHSSLARALSVLGGDDESGCDILDAGEGNDKNAYTPFFQTGSGKMVNVSTAGLLRAKALLGVEDDNDQYASKSSGYSGNISTMNNAYRRQTPSDFSRMTDPNSSTCVDQASGSKCLFTGKSSHLTSEVKDLNEPNFMQPNMMHDVLSKSAPIKFQTAGGRSISISGDALKRAKSLLGNPEIEGFLNEENDQGFTCDVSNKENVPFVSFLYQGPPNRKDMSRSFISPLCSNSNILHTFDASERPNTGINLIGKFDEVLHDCAPRSDGDRVSLSKTLREGSSAPSPVKDKSSGNDGTKNYQHVRPLSGPLADISNKTVPYHKSNGKSSKRRIFSTTSSLSPFKRPRSLKFSTPFKRNCAFLPNGPSSLLPEHSLSKGRLCTQYPFRSQRVYIKEYVKGPPVIHKMQCPNLLREINSGNADKFMFHDDFGLESTGAESFFQMIVRHGASPQYASKWWVTNHYRWIVWKLASYEKGYPDIFSGKLLTVTNVLEELKYRYEREVNHGHRSAIKRILEGDASPASMLVLCISAIHSNGNLKDASSSAKVELTDGWYAIDVLLDTLLSKQLALGRIFVGQKLRIWGARLCGWAGPVSPVEAAGTVSLLLHMNGTYRAHWAVKLGFCKSIGDPLAFRCIKSNGGMVPQTIVGVKRIYPVLYKERLSGGGSIVRSEKMEMNIRQLFNQSRAKVIEGVISEFQKGGQDNALFEDSESEGAKISKILESAAEPEILMAEMSPEQLNSFAAYRSKMEAIKRLDTEKSIEKALVDAGLKEREVTPFMRLRVVGLRSKNHDQKIGPEEGFITIWNPTERQQGDMVEGQAYVISGLTPIQSDSDTLYLQATGSTTRWRHLSPHEAAIFLPFFECRRPAYLSNLGEVPLSSEFDIAAYVIYVGEVYANAWQKRQWVFVIDVSSAELQAGELSESVLAISFSSPYVDDLSFPPVNANLAGSTVGFCNLIKRAKDQINNLWVAEATENSTYFVSLDHRYCSHLKDVAANIERWARSSQLTINRLKDKILFITGDCK